MATDENGTAPNVPPITAPEPDFWDNSIPNFLEHRIQLRCIAERAAHNGEVHGDE